MPTKRSLNKPRTSRNISADSCPIEYSTDRGEPVTITYHVPTLGPIKAKLYPLAEQCYELLDRRGHIERMKSMHQLGVVGELYQGAHHSRWEYVVTQLFLISELCGLKDDGGNSIIQGTGLGSKLSKSDDCPSGAEALQCLVLLLNAGHLRGSFSTEDGLLQAIFNDGNLLSAIMGTNGTNWADFAAYIKSVVDGKQHYQMHKIVSLFFLCRYWRGTDKGLVERLVEVLKFFLLDSQTVGQKRGNLLRVFERVRMLCYLALDSLYTPVIMHLDLARVFFNLEETGPLLVARSPNPLTRELVSFAQLMEREVYMKPEVLLFHEIHARSALAFIKRRYGCSGDLKSYEISDMKKLLLDLQSTDISTRFHRPKHVAGLTIPVPFPLSSPEIADTLRKKTRSSKNISRTAFASPSASEVIMAIGIDEEVTRKEQNLFFKSLLRNLTAWSGESGAMPSAERCLRSNNWGSTVAEWIVMHKAAAGIQVLRQEWKRSPASWICRGCRSAREAVHRAWEETSNSSRKHEIMTHYEALRNESFRGPCLSCLVPLDVTRADGTSVTDIDGVSFFTRNGQLWVLIVEAKNQQRGGESAAKKQLEQRLKEMGIWRELTNPQVHSIDHYGACVCAPFLD